MPYELFWHLNPKKLEPFFASQRVLAKQRYQEMDILAWNVGRYTANAIASCFSRSAQYPDKPASAENEMTDADRFAQFVRFKSRAAQKFH